MIIRLPTTPAVGNKTVQRRPPSLSSVSYDPRELGLSEHRHTAINE